MNTEHYVQLYLMLVLVVVVAYYVSLWDVARMRRRALEQAEQQHLLDVLKRK